MAASSASAATGARTAGTAVLPILLAVSAGHFLNDTMQSALLSIYPLIKEPLALDFVHIGIITLAFQLTASILQPMIGLYTDKHPQPFSLPFGMASTFVGMLLLAVAGGFVAVLLAAALIGIGSSVFHPEASRVARLAAGGRYGFAQSVFQVGGNAGQAISPLLVALLVIPNGQLYIAWFALAAVIGTLILSRVGRWYRDHLARPRSGGATVATLSPVGRRRVIGVLPLSLALPFVSLFWTDVLAVLIGLTLASAFPAIVVYGQEFLPGRVGMIAGLFFGFAFGMGGIGAALIGWLADARGIEWAFRLSALLPAIGLLVVFLPSLDERRA
jgi:FSR family fosmidomycin resistance protein-like MFS transporter